MSQTFTIDPNIPLPAPEEGQYPHPEWVTFAEVSDFSVKLAHGCVMTARDQRHDPTPATDAEMRELFRLSEAEFAQALRELEDLGFLEPYGEGWWVHLEAPEAYQGPRNAAEARERYAKGDPQP